MMRHMANLELRLDGRATLPDLPLADPPASLLALGMSRTRNRDGFATMAALASSISRTCFRWLASAAASAAAARASASALDAAAFAATFAAASAFASASAFSASARAAASAAALAALASAIDAAALAAASA
jgi:hypothetical protein